MTQTLQEAMLQAGLISKEKLDSTQRGGKKRPRKSEGSPRPAISAGGGSAFGGQREESPSILHEGKHEHHFRTECEACKGSSPDVEFYEHRNRMLSVRWLCIKCADQHRIPDDCRLTEQSQFSKTGRFLREFGATKIFK